MSSNRSTSMSTSAHLFTGRVLKSRGALIGALAAAMSVWGARPAEGNPPQDVAALEAKAEIEDLAVRYARASDAIGRGDVELGRQLYRSCFTNDALIEYVLPGQGPGAPPSGSVTGPDAYTNFVVTTVSLSGYTAMHHQIGNVQIVMQGNSATMSSYVTAYPVIDWSSRIDLATASYTDQVVKTPAGWRIAHRVARVASSMPLSGSPIQSP
jgi:hypothetical protein